MVLKAQITVKSIFFETVLVFSLEKFKQLPHTWPKIQKTAHYFLSRVLGSSNNCETVSVLTLGMFKQLPSTCCLRECKQLPISWSWKFHQLPDSVGLESSNFDFKQLTNTSGVESSNNCQFISLWKFEEPPNGFSL